MRISDWSSDVCSSDLRLRTRAFPWLFASMWFAAVANSAAADLTQIPAATQRPIDFGKEIQPIFEASCYQCPGPEKAEAGLRLDARAGALTEGEAGGAIVRGTGAERRQVQGINGVSADAAPIATTAGETKPGKIYNLST